MAPKKERYRVGQGQKWPKNEGRHFERSLTYPDMCVRRQNFFHQKSHFPAKTIIVHKQQRSVHYKKIQCFNIGNSLYV